MKTQTQTQRKLLEFNTKNIVELNNKDLNQVNGGTSHMSPLLPSSIITLF